MIKIIRKELLRLSLHYPEASHTPETLQMLAEDWDDDLKDHYVSEKDFRYCIKETRKTSRFFPKIYDFIIALTEYRRSSSYEIEANKSLQIEAHSTKTKTDCETNKKCIAVMGRVATGQISGEEGAKLCEDIIGKQFTL